jgi:hypothetical protein
VADRAALVIAVETFFEAGPAVPYAASDCAEVYRLLPSAGYNPQKCVLLAGTRTTKAVIEWQLKRLPKLIDPADSLLVLVVTRGFCHKKRGYLLCADTIGTEPGETALPVSETALPVSDLLANLHKTGCREITVLLDVDAHTAAGEKTPRGLDADELRSLFASSPVCVGLLSCEPGSRSYESVTLRRGIWRHHLIEALSGKARSALSRDGTLTATALHDYLSEAVPRTLRRTYDPPCEQSPLLLGEPGREFVIADLSARPGAGQELLDPGRLRRVVFRGETTGRVKELAGFRKTHSLPERANDWARRYVNRIAAADIRADLDRTVEKIREAFGYRRKDLEVSAERHGLGYIRTPDFEYSVAVTLREDEPAEVIWRREVGRLSGLDIVHSDGFHAVFGHNFDQLVFEFSTSLDVSDFIDQIEDDPPEGVKLLISGASEQAKLVLAGFDGHIHVTAQGVTIYGPPGQPASLLGQFLAFLRKFSGSDRAKVFPAL